MVTLALQGDFVYPFGFWNPWKILANLAGLAIVGGLVWLLAWIIAGSVAASASNGGTSLLQSFDYLTVHILLPLVCLFTALLVLLLPPPPLLPKFLSHRLRLLLQLRRRWILLIF